jgi:NADPH:quinone reductase-like Zn-dependent oxidoreductase
MRAITYTAAGGPDVVALDDRLPEPVPGPGQARVAVRAAGLNRADVIQRKGGYPAPAGWPADIPGLEYAGEVDAVGEHTRRWKPGDRIMGLVGGGAHAEKVVIYEDEALPIPSHLSWAEAAAIPEAFLTAWDALVIRGQLIAGETVLVHAVGSGVGTAAVQLAKNLGATVIGSSRSASKLERVRELGLDFGINTSDGGFRDKVQMPVNVVIDMLGGPAFADNLELLAPLGRLVLLGFLQGSSVGPLSLEPILRKRLQVIGTVMRARPREERAPLVAAFMRQVLPRFGGPRSPRRSMARPDRASRPAEPEPPKRPEPDEGMVPLHPVVHQVFPFAEIARAHAAMEQNEPVGKIVLTW